MVDSVRRCTPNDKDTIWDIVSYAYSVSETSHETFLERLDLIGNEFFLSEVDGVPVALARALDFEQNIRGVLKPMGGIGMVASSPEHRRMGHTHKLILNILNALRKTGCATSTLYPFKDSFYGEVGYVKMPPSNTLEFNPNSLSSIQLPGGFSAKREEGEEMLKVRRALHDSMVSQTHGAVKRSDKRWEELTKNFALKAVVARNGSGEPEAIMIYSIKGYGEGHSWAETGQINIVEFTWSSLEGRDAILHFLYKHADQIMKATMVISSKSEDYYQWLSNIHTPTTRSNIVSMARILDVGTSLSELPVEHSGCALFKVLDNHIKENNLVFEAYDDNGRLSVKESKSHAETRIRIEGLTAILYGTLNEAQIRRLGWLEGESPRDLFRWFSPATPWLTENF
jgi:predicted acetyltransferase